MKKRIIYALTLIGITSMASQIVLMRELLIVFYGNELSLGISLASWLFWIALGSWVIGRTFANKITQKIIVFGLCQIILAFTLPLSILAVRFIPLAFQFSPGEIIDIIAMVISTFILLAPICILGGFLFVLGCEIYKESKSDSVAIGYTYILEAIGATIGGLSTSLFLIRFFNPINIMVFIGILNLLAATLLLWNKKILFSIAAVILAGFSFMLVSGRVNDLRTLSLNIQWRNYSLLVSKNSVYGNIAITRRRNLFSVFTNGLYAFTVPDELNSERKAHFSLLEHPNPKEILLIGGGSSGLLTDILKHPIEKVDYVELDPLIISLTKKYLPQNSALRDNRVKIITDTDGRLFVKRTSNKYDVVIIGLAEPHTAQLNRFYTKEFYLEVNNILKEGGILSFSLSSNPNYISQEQAQLYQTLKRTLEEVFVDVKITPGETNYFLASNAENVLTLDWHILMRRLHKRKIDAKYMREYYLFSELSQERINFFNQRLSQETADIINTDFRPIAYYYDMVLWNTFFKYNLKTLFQIINAKRIYFAAACIYLFLLIPILIRPLRRNATNWPILVCVGTTGFAEISFQIVTLLVFQVLYGYVYYKLGIILTSYMMGLILGGWVITKRLEKGQVDYGLFIKTQLAIFIYPLFLPVLFLLFSGLKSHVSFWLGSNVIFAFLPVIPGLVGGFQFPLANSLYMRTKGTQISHVAGLTYGLDLFGSCIGAILTSVILIPIIGISMICFLVAGLNFIGLFLLLKSRFT
jgi:spermidine synthase